MRAIGFSTGAVAPGNVSLALELLRQVEASAVELSALRSAELEPLVAAFDFLPIQRYRYIAVHAPIDVTPATEAWTATLLYRLLPRVHCIVVHPDAIIDPACWSGFGHQLCIENMDRRKRTGRTAAELLEVFRYLTYATLCIDLAHARQVDPSLIETHRIATTFHDRIRQLHMSELSANGHHARMSATTRMIYGSLLRLFPPSTPVILEAPVTAAELQHEFWLAAGVLTAQLSNTMTTGGDPVPRR